MLLATTNLETINNLFDWPDPLNERWPNKEKKERHFLVKKGKVCRHFEVRINDSGSRRTIKRTNGEKWF